MTRPTRLLLVLTASTALACGLWGGGEEEVTSEAAVLAPSDLVVAERKPISDGARISGTVEPARTSVLRAEAAGSVEAVEVELGQAVKKGDLLVRIESGVAREGWTSARSGLTSAEQDVAVAKRELERANRLVEAGAISPRDREQAESALISAQARLQDAKARVTTAGEQVEGTAVKSPIDGVISQKAVNVGDVVAPGAPLVTVIDPTSLRVEGSVPTTAIGSLAVGTPVRFQVQGTDRAFEGTIAQVAPAVDAATRQIPVIVDVPNADGLVVAGLFVEGEIAAQAHEGIVVPMDAVDMLGARPSVMRVQGGKVERVEVELGLHDDQAEVVEIVSGVAEGDTLVLGGGRDLEPGEAVEVKGPAQSAGNEG